MLRVFKITLLVAAMAAAPAVAGDMKIALLKSMVRGTSREKLGVMQENFQSVMKAQTGLDGYVVIVDSADELRRQLEDGDINLGAFSGFEFAWMKIKSPELQPLLLASPEPGALQSVVVVAKGSPAKNVGDLRGKKLLMTSDTNEPCRLFLSRRCRYFGSTSEKLFLSIDAPTSVEKALDEVVNGAASAALTDRSALKMFERRKPARFAKLRVLEESEPFLPPVVAYRKGKLDEATLKKFRDGMIAAHTTAAGEHLMGQIKIKRFDEVPPDFDKRLAETVKKYSPG